MLPSTVGVIGGGQMGWGELAVHFACRNAVACICLAFKCTINLFQHHIRGCRWSTASAWASGPFAGMCPPA